MSYPTRSFSSHLRGASASGSSSGHSPALVARIEEKKAELAHLQELKELSAAVATQMEELEKKLSTLSDGTEGRIYWNFSSFAALVLTVSQPSLLSLATGIMCYVPSIWHQV